MIQEKPTTRFIVLAHNAHVSKRDTGNFPALGSYLRKTFGNGYYAFGFAFNRGSFQAQVAGQGTPRVQEFTLGDAPERTVDWYLARTGIASYIVDFRRLPKLLCAENTAFGGSRHGNKPFDWSLKDRKENLKKAMPNERAYRLKGLRSRYDTVQRPSHFDLSAKGREANC